MSQEEGDWAMEDSMTHNNTMADEDGWDDADDANWGDINDESKNDWEESSSSSIPPPSLKRSFSFQVLDYKSLEGKMKNLIEQTAEILDVSLWEAACLLRTYGWKAKKLEQDWFENQTKVRQTAGLTPDDQKPVVQGSIRQCETAYCDEVAIDQGYALNCGHFFCNECWKCYLESQLRIGSTCVNTSCMGMKCKLNHNHKFGCHCNEAVPSSLFFKFVPADNPLLPKYTRWLLDSFVEGQKNIKWCPRGCNNAVTYNVGGTQSVTCKCGHSFCFSCLEQIHSPAPCDLVKRWLQREKSDDATEIWLAAKTKECPKCNVRIEKNRACNHMKCVKCGHDFCWLCKGDWSKHGSSTGGYYVCTKFETDQKEGKLSDEEKNIQENQQLLQKYTYYYKRYKDSASGIDLTRKLGERLEVKMKDKDVHAYSFLLDAVEKLVQARRVLQWTYMLAYYMKSGGQKQLFEYQLDMLISNTEALQDVMENTDPESLIVDKRKEVLNRTSSIEKFRSEMVQQIERGEFEDLLMVKADTDIGDKWACVVCTKENKKEASFCSGCSACKKHGEPECKACPNPSKKR